MNFLRNLGRVLAVMTSIIGVVILGWAAGVGMSGAIGVDPTVPVIVCMIVPLLALGLWMERPAPPRKSE